MALASSPLALGATMMRWRAITDQSEKVPEPPTLVTLIARIVPSAPVTVPAILLAGLARLRTSTVCPLYTMGAPVMLGTTKFCSPVAIVLLVLDWVSWFQIMPA